MPRAAEAADDTSSTVEAIFAPSMPARTERACPAAASRLPTSEDTCAGSIPCVSAASRWLVVPRSPIRPRIAAASTSSTTARTPALIAFTLSTVAATLLPSTAARTPFTRPAARSMFSSVERTRAGSTDSRTPFTDSTVSLRPAVRRPRSRLADVAEAMIVSRASPCWPSRCEKAAAPSSVAATLAGSTAPTISSTWLTVASILPERPSSATAASPADCMKSATPSLLAARDCANVSILVNVLVRLS